MWSNMSVHVNTTAHFFLLAQWQKVQSKLTFAWRGSACRYDCTFLLLLLLLLLLVLDQYRLSVNNYSSHLDIGD